MNRADHHSATFPTERSGAVQLSRNRASCQSRRSNTASRAAGTKSMLAAHEPVCTAATPVVTTPAAFGTKLGSNVAYLSRRGFLRTHALPLLWFQIARSGAFYLYFRIRPRVSNLTNMRPKRPGRVSPYRPGRRGQPAARAAIPSVIAKAVIRRSERHRAIDL